MYRMFVINYIKKCTERRTKTIQEYKSMYNYVEAKAPLPEQICSGRTDEQKANVLSIFNLARRKPYLSFKFHGVIKKRVEQNL